MPIERCRAAIERFRAFVVRDPRSFASGRANQESDVDVYVIAGEQEVFVDRDRLLDGVEFPLL